MNIKKFLFVVLLFEFCFSQLEPGDIIWEENFDNLNNWIIETGNGSWGWGNGELQYYKSENIEIVEIPDEIGNNAVQITAKQESGADIIDQWGNPLNYTSGRMNTKSKISVKYGIIEARVLIPDISKRLFMPGKSRTSSFSTTGASSFSIFPVGIFVNGITSTPNPSLVCLTQPWG